MWRRLADNWVYATLPVALLLLALVPLLHGRWPLPVLATYLMLPLYFLHQWEEHENDRFRRFVNDLAGQGRDVLSRTAICVINLPGVWGVILVALWMSDRVRPGLGLIAVYLVLVNAAGHIGAGLALRRSNPGLVTSILLFLPVGLWALHVIDQAGATASDHLIGFGVAAAIHLAILAHVAARRRLPG